MSKKQKQEVVGVHRNLACLYMLLNYGSKGRKEPNDKIKASRNACRKKVRLDVDN